MKPITFSDFRPRCEVEITTPNGIKYTNSDLRRALLSVHITRDVSGSPGAFGITLTAESPNHDGKTWRDLITPMSYVEIRMGNQGSGVASLSPGSRVNIWGARAKLPIHFRGFVDNSMHSLAMQPAGGPQRAVTINGRCYSKLLIMANIQYLWSSSVIAAGVAAANFGLTFNYDLPWVINNVSDFVHGVIDTIFNGSTPQPAQWSAKDIIQNANAVNPNNAPGPAGYGGGGGQAFLPAFREGGVHVPNIQIACSVPDEYSIVSLAVQPYTGSFWNLLTYFQSAPLGECFIYDAEDAPVLVYRVVPLKDESGMWVFPAQDPGTLPHQLGHVFTDSDVISADSVALSDNEVYNYFFVYADTAATDGGSSAAYVSSNVGGTNFSVYEGGNLTSNPYWISESTRRFGLRPLNICSPWVPYITKNGDYQRLSVALATFSGKVYGHNEKLLSGYLIGHGSEYWIPGRYLGYTDKNTGLLYSYYIESVEETFNFIGASEPGWTAQLGVTRGQLTESFAPAKQVK